MDATGAAARGAGMDATGAAVAAGAGRVGFNRRVCRTGVDATGAAEEAEEAEVAEAPRVARGRHIRLTAAGAEGAAEAEGAGRAEGAAEAVGAGRAEGAGRAAGSARTESQVGADKMGTTVVGAAVANGPGGFFPSRCFSIALPL